MPGHTGGGVTTMRGRVDGLPSSVKVFGDRPKPGLKGHPTRGKSPGSVQAAASQGEAQAKNPRK